MGCSHGPFLADERDMGAFHWTRNPLGRLLGRRRRGPGLDAFRERLASYLAVFHPGVKLLSMVVPSYTVLRVENQEVVVDFRLLYSWYGKNPESLGPLLDEFLEELTRQLSSRPIPPFEDVVDLLFPQVRTLDFLKRFSPRFGKGRLARIEVGAGLYMLFVMDERRGMTFVNESHLEAWGVSPETLKNLSLRNLSSLGEKLDGRGRLESHDGYAAAHILLLDRLMGLPPGGSVLAAIPHRDLLLAAPERNDETAKESLALEAYTLYREATRPILPDLLVCTALEGGGISLEREGAPAFNA